MHRGVYIVREVLDRGADVNVRDSGDETALMAASLGGNSAMVSKLSARGADDLTCGPRGC